MALQKIPLRSDVPAYSFRLDLQGRAYNFYIRYNERMNLWTMNLSDEDNQPIIVGKLIFTGLDILYGMTDLRLPPGPIIPFEETGKVVDAGADDLGESVNVFYDEV